MSQKPPQDNNTSSKKENVFKLSVTPVRVGGRGNKERNSVTRQDTSRQLEAHTSFASFAGSHNIITPPYDMLVLQNIIEQSNILRPCIDCMATNIVMFGYRVVPLSEEVPMKSSETNILRSFITSANVTESMTTVNSKALFDYEHYGFSYREVIRNISGQVTLIKHIPAYTVRITEQDSEEIPVKVNVVRGGKRSTVIERRRFRRYIQIINSKRVYFKEFGDPRNMHYETGEFEEQILKNGGKEIPHDKLATEILHEKQGPNIYGIPRWIAQLPSILGSREAEEVNMRYFEDNTIPPAIMSIAGGRLTRESFQHLQEILTMEKLGKDRQHQILLIEAIPESTGLDDNQKNVRIQIDKLSDQRQTDSLFGEYDEKNRGKVRSSFRLPSMLLGEDTGVNFSNANVGIFMAETQVFAPERMRHDEYINRNFVNHPEGLGLETVKLESKGPVITDPDRIVKTMTAMNPMGGITPRTAILLVNETMQLGIPAYPEQGEEGYEDWMDQPMPLTMREQRTQQTEEGRRTHLEQEIKDQNIKDLEEDGDISGPPVDIVE